MEQIKETAFDWTSRDKRGYFTSNEQALIQKMMLYGETRPEEVTIIKTPETNGGYLMAKIPKTWMSVKPPHKKNLTVEQREDIRKRLAESKKNAG